MKKSIFEMLGIADQERVHTQVLAWLLTPADSPLTKDQRATLIFALFGVHTQAADADQVRVITELKGLDLVVLHPGAFIAVENKMKSRQGTDQLRRYDEEIKELKVKLKIDKDRSEVKILLNFSGEAPYAGWKSLDYKTVADVLVGLSLPPSCYAADYSFMLSTLVEHRNTFLEDHKNYPDIFRRSGWNSLKRLTNPLSRNACPLLQFVSSNRLERVFVEGLYRKAINKAGYPNAEVTESHGTALIHINLFSLSINNDKMQFQAGFQLQGQTIKLNVGAIDYNNSNKSMLTETASDSFDCHIKEVASHFEVGQLRTNTARSKAYRSWTRQITPEKVLEKQTLDDFCEFLENEVGQAMKIWENVLKNMCQKKATVQKYERINVPAGVRETSHIRVQRVENPPSEKPNLYGTDKDDPRNDKFF